MSLKRALLLKMSKRYSLLFFGKDVLIRIGKKERVLFRNKGNELDFFICFLIF